MTTINVIGAPFPKQAPLFASDQSLQKKLQQVESFIEMHHDIRDITNFIDTAKRLSNLMTLSMSGDISYHDAIDSLGIASLIIYARLFNSTTGRTSLNEHDIFSDTISHDQFIDIRDKFLAHQGWNANQHQLFFFQSTETEPIRMNPFGQTTRIPVWHNIDWDQFSMCTQQVSDYLSKRIHDLCRSIEHSLTPEQSSFLDTTPVNLLFENYWMEHPNRRKDPFSPRTAP